MHSGIDTIEFEPDNYLSKLTAEQDGAGQPDNHPEKS